MKYFVGIVGACLFLAPAGVYAKKPTAAAAAPSFKPTVDDWIGVNAAVNNYTLGLELNDTARFDKAFWPEATIIVQPEPGKSFTMPYKFAAGGPPPPGAMPPPGMMPPPSGAMPPPPGGMPAAPAGAPSTNVIGTNVPPWHLSLSHNFEFQSSTRATHYGYFVSVYPDLKTKISTVGLPGHYADVLEKRNGEWRIIERTTAIGAK